MQHRLVDQPLECAVGVDHASASRYFSAVAAACSTWSLNGREFLGRAIAEGAAEVPRVHALDDAGQLPEGERHVEVELRDVATGHLGVALGELVSVPEPGRRRRRAAPGAGGVVRAVPVHLQEPDVGERIAERADLPVEHGDDVAVAVDHRVVEAVVAVDEAGRALFGDARQQALVHPVDRCQFARLALVPLAVPTLELSFDVALVASERVQADRLEIDGVDGCHRVDERPARVGAGALGQRAFGRLAVAQHVTVDEAHDVERRAVDAQVVTEAFDRRNGNRRALQCRQDAVLATHVVGAREDVAERRPAQHECRSARAGDPERQVRVAAGDHVEPERADRPGDVRFEPGRDRSDVDPRCVVHVVTHPVMCVRG